jgi:hypothetical protein
VSGGIPRLINLICDRALLAGFSVQANRITPDMIRHAAESLELRPSIVPRFGWLKRRASLLAGAAVVLLASALAVGMTAFLYQRFAMDSVQARGRTDADLPAIAKPGPLVNRRLPAGAALTILVDSYPDDPRSRPAAAELTQWLEASGYRVYYKHVDLGAEGRWQRVLAGAYTETDYEAAAWDAARLKAAAPALQAQVMTAAAAAAQQP